MNLLNSFLGLSLLIVMSFSLLKTIELSGCRHEMVSKGFWMASGMLVSSNKKKLGVSCGSPLFVKSKDSEILASQITGDYHFQLSTDINSEELK